MYGIQFMILIFFFLGRIWLFPLVIVIILLITQIIIYVSNFSLCYSLLLGSWSSVRRPATTVSLGSPTTTTKCMGTRTSAGLASFIVPKFPLLLSFFSLPSPLSSPLFQFFSLLLLPLLIFVFVSLLWACLLKCLRWVIKSNMVVYV